MERDEASGVTGPGGGLVYRFRHELEIVGGIGICAVLGFRLILATQDQTG